METMTVAKNLDFSFRYVFASSMTVQSFITMKKKEKREKGEEKNGKKLSTVKFSHFYFLTTSIGLLEKTAE